MTGPLYLYDDQQARRFEPFALTRPVGELRAGTEIVRRRWSLALGTPAAGFLAASHLADFEELDAPHAAQETLPAGAVVVNTRAIPRLARAAAEVDVWRLFDRVAAVRLREPVDAARLADGTLPLEALAPADAREGAIEGRWVEQVWDYVGQLGAQLAEDIPLTAGRLGLDPVEAPAHVVILGTHPVFIAPGGAVEPFVVLDASDGPILVREGAVVQSFTRVVGPCHVGAGSTVVGDRIANCSIGDVSRIHGEISTTIVLGHTNKAHDGFVGHSYLGRWVNLGAGTTTSNLKNTYGTVALWTPEGIRDTGLQFLGTFFGDHAKTGIGLRLTTGSVVGAGANIYGSRMPGKVVPPFAWGEGHELGEYDAEKFLTVAARAMSRRQVTLGERGRRHLASAHARRWTAYS